MIDEKRWATFFRGEDVPTLEELYDAMDEKFTCPRCGRPDLPLALFPHHNRSCAYECALGGHAIDVVSDLRAENEELKERIEKLEMSCRDGLTTIHWFEGWLNGRSTPVTYDDTMCNTCDHKRSDHDRDHECRWTNSNGGGCACTGYRYKHYSVSYTGRDVARMKNSIAKALGPKSLSHHLKDYGNLFPSSEMPTFKCRMCDGVFDHQYRSKSDWSACEWCNRRP